jgi:hypothetical protein
MRLSLITTLVVVTHFAIGQDKLLKFEEGQYAYPRLNLGEAGFVYSFPDNKKKKTSIKYFSTDLEVIWEKEAEAKYSLKRGDDSYGTHYDMSESFLVATPSNSLIYYVEWSPGNLYQKPFYATQLTKAGDVKKFTVNGRDDFGYMPQASFCDEEYFYILSTDEGRQQHDKKKATEKLILNRFDAKTFGYKKIILDVPPVEAGDNTTYWVYAGQNATEKFLVSKKIDYEANKAVITCVAFDNEGKITRTFNIEPDLKDSFFRPARNIYDRNRSFHQVANLDYTTVESKSSATGIVYTLPKIDYSAFTNVVYDDKTDAFYVFGLMGPKTFTKMASVYNGYYVIKYDPKGTLVWQALEKAPKTLADYGAFRIHSTPELRNIGFRIGNDRSFNFMVQTKKLLALFALDADGKIARTNFDNDFTAETTDLYLTTTPSKAEAYVRKFSNQKRAPQFERYVLPDRDIVFERPFSDPEQLLLFKK